MRGHDVLHPMGWDAFGLPAENAAIERGVDPAEWTEQNIAKMKEQLRSISASFDWDREVATCAPEFYEHTQRIFLMLFEKGLAYQAKALVNYDPVDKTVLANEQVDANGFSWRSGAKVEKLNLKQWFFRITDFKEALLKDLDSLAGGWPDRVLSMQRNWIGKSVGAKITFPVSIEGQDGEVNVDVFTTRPDTLYGVEYLALCLDHPIVRKAAEKDSALRTFLDGASSLPADSKAGYRLNGVTASHPLRKIDNESAHVQRELPIFVAPYVLSDYGEGAVMGVPGHDARDISFFKENVNPESIAIVIGENEASETLIPAQDAKAFTQDGVLTSHCWKYQGLHSREAAKQIVNDLQQVGQADFKETWRLRDWLISRQRYWGTPIPIIHCGDCGAVPVPAKDLPSGFTPIVQAAEAQRADTDTMDTFVDSSWYYLRFLDSKNKDAPFSPSVVRPVNVYIGGVEHAILHLLSPPNVSYEKMSKSKYNGVDPTACATKYGADATRAHILFSAPVSEVLEWDETKIVGVERWFGRLWKLVLDAQHQLTKSSLVFSASYLNTAGHAVSLPSFLQDLSDSDADAVLATHNTISSVTSCIESNPYGLNTVISDLTKLTNTLSSTPPSSPLVYYLSLSTLLRLLAPIAPALASETWEMLHQPLIKDSTSIHSILSSPWPTDLLTAEQAEALAARGGQTVAIQINGKLRCAVTIPRMMSPTSLPQSKGPSQEEQDWIITRVLETAEGKLWLREKNDWEKRRRVIVVKGGKLVNVVF
ncbi:Aminoacyl-tRNA synthetase class 1a anticodon-binding [Penicillium maclennaniae]|uniref:Aminoacyl-tRNA synthetase class 1a anticodon-binding n=1 Tax=Penicillium maclennaniae TaxID=1343394 RepID=UPI00253FA370|nr:Aminoacyl-tRNA synthetase class 1a anticodon-binding [Penicillium maclennaniae]KAJ5674820.1 Aminoacyl-tRNA synthetase class 1a anticodon-binding [Penicillium maclennaniae]